MERIKNFADKGTSINLRKYEFSAKKAKRQRGQASLFSRKVIEDTVKPRNPGRTLVPVDEEGAAIRDGRRLDRLNKKLNSGVKETPMKEEVKGNTLELREIIGLPVVYGKDPHVKDDLYGFLVREVCSFDAFGIFEGYDSLKTNEIPQDLASKINQVKGLVEGLLNSGLSEPKWRKKYHEFVEIHRKEWHIVDRRKH
jgi:hypothetical protein